MADQYTATTRGFTPTTTENLERLNYYTDMQSVSVEDATYLDRVNELLAAYKEDCKSFLLDIKILEEAKAMEENDDDDDDNKSSKLSYLGHSSGENGSDATVTMKSMQPSRSPSPPPPRTTVEQQEKAENRIKQLKEDLLTAQFFVTKLTLYRNKVEKTIKKKQTDDKVEYLLAKE